jgi:ribonuclease HII
MSAKIEALLKLMGLFTGPSAFTNFLLVLIFGLAGVGYYEFQDSKELEREKRKEELQLIRTVTEALTNNSIAIYKIDKQLEDVDKALKSSSDYEIATEIRRLNYKLDILEGIKKNQEKLITFLDSITVDKRKLNIRVEKLHP